MSNSASTTPAGQPAVSQVTIKILGVGGAGINALAAVHAGGLQGLPCLAAHTDARALERAVCSDRLLLGASSSRGLGVGGDPDLGRAAAEQDCAAAREFCCGADVVFLFAGMGRGTGTGAAPVLARAARETGALVLAIVTLPFQCEGTRRRRQAQLGLRQLQAAADGVICLPNQSVLQLVAAESSLQETLTRANAFLVDGVRGIWRLLTQHGLLDVNFADLCAVVRGRHAESSFASVETSGDSRVRDALEQLTRHPLLDEGRAIASADALLVSVVGGPELAISDLDALMEPMNRQAENAHVVLGVATDDSFRGRLGVTVVAARRGNGESGKDAAKEPLAQSAANESDGNVETPGSDTQFFARPAPPVARPRFVPPAPQLSDEQKHELFKQQGSGGRRGRKSASGPRQGMLPLEIVHRGRFAKIEPTIHRGEDLDVPTYIRRGVILN